MKPKKVPFSLIGMGLGAALCATVITRTLLGGPPTVPRTADVVKAGREEPPPAGRSEPRPKPYRIELSGGGFAPVSDGVVVAPGVSISGRF